MFFTAEITLCPDGTHMFHVYAHKERGEWELVQTQSGYVGDIADSGVFDAIYEYCPMDTPIIMNYG